jgi:RNA polymerase sigma-70 factor (ECF subfamily)
MLVERYQNRAFRTALGMLRDREDALEVAQDAFVRAYRSIGSFRGEAEFSTWLHRIVTNLAKNRIRYRRRRRDEWKVSLDADPDESGAVFVREQADPAEDPAALVAARDFHERVREALGELPDSMREVLCMRDVDGLSYAEIADALQCELGTVKSRIFRAREALRQSVIHHE